MSQSGQSREPFMPSAKAERQEIHNIKQELKKRGMLEDGMSPEDMINLLRVVVESENEPGNAREKTPEPSLPVTQNSYANSVTGNLTASERKSVSPDASSSQQSDGKKLSQEKQRNSLDESICEVRSGNTSHRGGKEVQHYNNSNRGRIESDKAARVRESKTFNRRRPKWPLELEDIPKCKINPLDVTENRKDARLEQHYCSRDNSNCNKISNTRGCSPDSFDNSEEAIAQLCNHLRQIAEISHNQHSSSDDTNFEWGTCIQIGETDETNVERESNAEEESSSDFTDDKNRPPQTISDNTIVGDSKRRRKVYARSNYDEASEEDNEERENSDEDFELSAKRQKTAASSSSSARDSRPTSRTTEKTDTASQTIVTNSQPAEKTSVDKRVHEQVASTIVHVLDECTISDDDDDTIDQPPRKVRRNKTEENETVYPRRIVPPKPGAKSSKLLPRKSLFGRPIAESRRAKKQIEEGEGNIAQTIKSRTRDEGTAKVSEQKNQDDEHRGDEPVIPLERDPLEIKPLRISSRMKLQSQRLIQLQEKEKEMEFVRREEKRIKEEAIRLEKMYRVQQRIREEKEKQKRQEEAEKAKAKREEDWRAFVNHGDKKRSVERTELHPDGRPRINEANVQTNNTMDQSKNAFVHLIEDEIEQRKTRVRCPICNRSFTTETIEAHAGACEEYDSSLPGISKSNSPSLTPPKYIASKRKNTAKLLNCEICDNFSTDKGNLYEDHVTECLKRKKYGEPFTPDTIIEVPTSPIRTVRTISEQTNSEINYKAQFVPRTRSNKIAGNKRKR